MGMSPCVHYQDDMKTNAKSGTLVAEAYSGMLMYRQKDCADSESVQIGSLSVGTRGGFNVGYFAVGVTDDVTMSLVMPTGTQCQGGFDTEYMTFTVGSTQFKATMVLPTWTEDMCGTEESVSYTATVAGFYAALDANNYTATITFDAPDLTLCDA